VDKAALRNKIMRSLRHQGFRTRRGLIVPPDANDKDTLRALHAEAVRARVERAAPGLRRHEERLLTYIASGPEVQPERIAPKLVPVRAKTVQELLFRYARLHWSIPVSAGYGRRLRYLVMDESNGKLIGLIGLGDPVQALRPRDNWVGWDRTARHEKLRCVMDAFVLGAVPPYSNLLCGKLVALLVTTAEIRRSFRRKYGHGRSVISQRKRDGRLALVTTASALGRSSMYNRLHIDGTTAYERVGFTRGSGEFHFSNGVYHAVTEYAQEHLEPTAKHERWGSGFRNRREIVRRCLRDIGLSPDLVYHGIQREIFVAPLARNTQDFLCGRANRLYWHPRTVESVFAEFRERWLLPRAQRDGKWCEFDRDDYSLWTSVQ